MTGVHPFAYWTADYLCDLFAMALTTIIIIFIFIFDPEQTFVDPEVLGIK